MSIAIVLQQRNAFVDFDAQGAGGILGQDVGDGTAHVQSRRAGWASGDHPG